MNERFFAIPILLFFATCVIFRIASCAEHVARMHAQQLQQPRANCDPRPPTK